MGVLVLIVGALLLVAGSYEMIAGSADILSERGWSAFIAGSVLVSGGVVTMAIGIAVRTIDSLGAALLQGRSVQARPFANNGSEPVEHTEPDSGFEPLVPAVAAIAQPEPLYEPSFDHSPTFDHSATFGHATTFEHAPTAPVQAAAPFENGYHDEGSSELVPASNSQHGEPELRAATDHEPHHDDWLDRSFADLEREMAAAPDHSNGAATEHEPLAATAEPVASSEADHYALDYETHLSATHEDAPAEPHAAPATDVAEHETAIEEPTSDHATVSAREEPAAPTSTVIGRYESEGTSYVMYADGSIDAQSAAGVYRFASMAELKTFIES